MPPGGTITQASAHAKREAEQKCNTLRRGPGKEAILKVVVRMASSHLHIELLPVTVDWLCVQKRMSSKADKPQPDTKSTLAGWGEQLHLGTRSNSSCHVRHNAALRTAST